jgi:hypothetical protein
MNRLAPAFLTLALATTVTAQQPDERMRIHVDVEDADLADVFAQISEQVAVTILVDPAVKEAVNVSLRDIPWREAVEVIARMTRCEIEDLAGGVLYVSQPGTLTLAGTDMDGRHVLELAARAGGRVPFVLPGVSGTIPAIDFKEVGWLKALGTAANMLNAAVYEFHGVLVVAPADLPVAGGEGAEAKPKPEPFTGGEPVSFNAKGHDLADVCELIGRKAQANVLVDPAVSETVKGHFKDVPWKDAVNALARLTGCDVEVRPGGIVLLTQPPQTTIQAHRAPLPELIKILADNAGKNVALAAGDYPEVTAELTNCHYRAAISVLAWAYGLRLEESTEDLLTLALDPSRPAPEAAQRPDDAIARLVDAIERSAREGDMTALSAQTQQLLALVERGRTPTEPPRPPVRDTHELERRIEKLFGEIEALAKERQVDELVAKFTELRQLLTEYGEAGTAEVRKTLARWHGRFSELGEVRLSIQLQVYINDGNRLLRELSDADDDASLDEAFRQLKQLTESMREEEREVFHRNADALILRGQSLYEAGKERLKNARLRLDVQAIVTGPPFGDEPPQAVINGTIYREGDVVADADGVRVLSIKPSVVKFRREDVVFSRGLGGER